MTTMRQATTTFLATLLATAVGHGQDQGGRAQSTATSKADVNLVEVHAVVTDERGEFVRDLTRDDFEIYESGKLQKPSVFSARRRAPGSTRVDDPRDAERGMNATSAPLVISLLFIGIPPPVWIEVAASKRLSQLPGPTQEP